MKNLCCVFNSLLVLCAYDTTVYRKVHSKCIVVKTYKNVSFYALIGKRSLLASERNFIFSSSREKAYCVNES